MGHVTRFQTRREQEDARQAELDLRVEAEIIEVGARLGWPADVVAIRRLAVKQKRAAQEAWRYMQVNTKREAEIIAHLKQHAEAWVEASEVLRAIRGTLTREDQRMSLTQADVAKELGLRTTHAARAFRALEAAGAIMNPVKVGKSRTWEVDARFASCMDLASRAAVEVRQQLERDAKANAAEPKQPAAFKAIEGGMAGIS